MDTSLDSYQICNINCQGRMFHKMVTWEGSPLHRKLSYHYKSLWRWEEDLYCQVFLLLFLSPCHDLFPCFYPFCFSPLLVIWIYGVENETVVLVIYFFYCMVTGIFVWGICLDDDLKSRKQINQLFEPKVDVLIFILWILWVQQRDYQHSRQKPCLSARLLLSS